MTETTGRCCAGGTVRDLVDLLRVTETGGLHRSRFVCRPDLDTPAPGRCFRDAVAARWHETITPAAEWPR